MKRKISILIVLVLVTIGSAYGFTRVGTAAGQFLKIPVGARPTGMAEAFVALADDPTALYWNPAGTAWLKKPGLTMTHTEWFVGINHEFAGAILPLGLSGVIGMNAVYLGSGRIEQTTIEQPDGTGSYFEVTNLSLGMTYSRCLTDHFSFGITGKYIQETIFHEKATAVAMDIGTLFITNFHGLRIGTCILNFGTRPKQEGRDLLVSHQISSDYPGNPAQTATLQTTDWPLPLNFKIGLATELIGGDQSFFKTKIHRLTSAIDWSHPSDNRERIAVGLEYGLRDRIFIRLGYKFNYDTEKFTSGMGIKVPIKGQKLTVDYALVDFGDLDAVHHFSLGTEF